MEKPIKSNIKIEHLIETSNYFYQNLLGYKPEQTSLQQVPKNQWSEFTNTRGLNPNSSGIYLPRNQTAVIQQNNPLSLFHEYFGHGLYCEKSQNGQALVNLEKKLLEEERQEFSSKKFTLEDIQKFRAGSQAFQGLDEFRKENLAQYETFAIWTEYLLSEKHNLKEKFGKKYDSFSREEKEAIDSVINFSESYGNLATFYASGLARKTTPKRIESLLEDIYKDKLKDVEFALIYGSKKDFSDIDVFMVGKTPQESHSDWLDVKYKSHKEFNNGLKNFDVRTCNPLMTGEFIFGDKNYFEKSKQKVLTQLITEKAIKHNLKWFHRMQRLKDKNSKDNFLTNKFGDYSQTYLGNALALRKGIKLFAKEDLLSYSQSEKLTQLKGGTENNAIRKYDRNVSAESF
ncbi:hypothetical protein KAS08_00855 [Candidatus Pacearchaeota archaeon]|nr:hypothetical protein [Candidatus Pacearchaeota archaeon]